MNNNNSIKTKKEKPVKNVGIIHNHQKPGGQALARELQAWFNSRGVEVRIPANLSQEHEQVYPAFSNGDFYVGLDCLVVMGGDGTLLRAARAMDDLSIPILGVNLGNLGFLTEVELSDIYPYLERLVTGDYEIEERMMLESQVVHEGRIIDTSRALNDVVVGKGPLSRIITLDTYIDEHYFATFSGDGLIISTPTGSTAYSLSAGGPIVSPAVEMILLTPICPHTFYSRPVVIAPTQRIRIIIRPRFDVVSFTVDGQHGFSLQANDEIIVSRSTCRTRLIKVSGRHFFDVIREKMGLTNLL